MGEVLKCTERNLSDLLNVSKYLDSIAYKEALSEWEIAILGELFMALRMYCFILMK